MAFGNAVESDTGAAVAGGAANGIAAPELLDPCAEAGAVRGPNGGPGSKDGSTPDQ